MNKESEVQASVQFPLRGEWVAVASPGDRVPSHGTDVLGQRFSYDFLRTDRRNRFHPAHALSTLSIGVPTNECYAWGQPVYMPFDGEIVEAQDGFPERSRVIPLREALLAMRNAATFNVSHDLRPIIGNYVVARSERVFAAFAHLAPGSISVEPRQALQTGEPVGRVGHTGNSTSPHLHFQLMNGPDPRTARGIPCVFRELDVERQGEWVAARDVVPRRGERLRYETQASRLLQPTGRPRATFRS